MQAPQVSSFLLVTVNSNSNSNSNYKRPTMSTPLFLSLLLILAHLQQQQQQPQVSCVMHSSLRFHPDTNAYTGLTLTFDPRLERRVEQLRFEHLQSIMQHSSSLLHESLSGRAHLAEVRVLVPYSWRSLDWLQLHKPIMMDRRSRYLDSDVMVGLDDLQSGLQSPYAVQHDACSRQGLHIHMPISFLEQHHQSQLPSRLKARLLVREFASHRYGIFKESGFRNDPMYPPFTQLATGLASSSGAGVRGPRQAGVPLVFAVADLVAAANATGSGPQQLLNSVRGFDATWNECQFDADPASGLPSSLQALQCAPYLTTSSSTSPQKQAIALEQHHSSQLAFNLMSADPFSYAPVSQQLNVGGSSSVYTSAGAGSSGSRAVPVDWRQLEGVAKWHFCGENFAPELSPKPLQPQPQQTPAAPTQPTSHPIQHQSFAHNQLAINKQNVMCNERSAMDVIKSSDDFGRSPFSPNTFNRLPEPTFRFLQEMPPRLILCVEYAAHLYQSRRLEQGILEAAIGKFLAFDLIADTEMALVLFGQRHSTRTPFRKLDSSVDSRLTLYSPALDPYEEPARLFTEQELEQLGLQPASSQTARLVKGSCSFAKALAEAQAALATRNQYDDQGADLIIITSGLFVEDEAKIEELLRASALSRPDSQLRLNIILYPSSMLFDTKTGGAQQVAPLDPVESEQVVRARLNKLLLIQRLAGAQLHLVREQLDASGNVKMSTLLQFYQIFEHLARGHSWDQTQSMLLLNQRLLEGRHLQPTGAGMVNQTRQLTYQFELDDSLDRELIVGFIDPKQQQTRGGKRFALRNLELRSPTGHLVLTDANPWSNAGTGNGGDEALDSQAESVSATETTNQVQSAESALFPYRAQLGLAGFHLQPSHLAPLKAARKLVGVWTLTANAEEPIQTSALAMARVSPSGDSLTGHCWIQSYHLPTSTESNSQTADMPEGSHKHLRSVKVFVRTQGGGRSAPLELNARMEVEDELGNIVQNTQMLDDGLGEPDMTKGDGIRSQYVHKAYRPGYYKVRIELTSPLQTSPSPSSGYNQIKQTQQSSATAPVENGQDQPCCGSYVPSPVPSESARYLNRQLYCGTFYVDYSNKLSLDQRPPRINNLTIARVDQDARQVTLRWYEPATQEPICGAPTSGELAPATDPLLETFSDDNQTADQPRGGRGRGYVLAGGLQQQQESLIANCYEVKLFTDRDAAKRAFDARPDVGHKFTDWNIEGLAPNTSVSGGPRELTLRIPHNRQGIYYIALRMHGPSSDSLGPVSPIVQFWLRNNVSADEAESLYGPGRDAEGNLYRNGHLVQRSGVPGYLGSQSQLDGLGLLVLFGILAFILALICITLVSCLVKTARRKLPANSAKDKHNTKGGADSHSSAAIIGAGSGSSLAGSNCGSSQSSELVSSSKDNQGCHEIEVSKLALADELCNFQRPPAGIHGQHQHQLSNLHHHQQQYQQQQMSKYLQCQQPSSGVRHSLDDVNRQLYQPAGNSDSWLQHTLVNGYAYATVQARDTCDQPAPMARVCGDLNENGLGGLVTSVASPVVPSWPADVLMSHYDKVKQARERNEAPPVVRFETLERPSQLGDVAGLPSVVNGLGVAELSGYPMRKKIHSAAAGQLSNTASYFSHQLQQQLSSVLKSKAASNAPCDPPNYSESSPALEGVRHEPLPDQNEITCSYGQHLADQMPPPQYIYQPIDQNAPLISGNEPTIYSQATGLQQVTNNQSNTNYYANQQHWTGGNIYSQPPDQEQQQQQDFDKSTISEV